MKRIMTVLALSAVAAAPAAAQWAGMPVWNSPKGGTGVTINGDLGMPSGTAKGTAFGARATLGLANLSVTAGIASFKPKGAAESATSVGGNAAFKIIGGSLIPVALNFQVGAARVSAANTDSAATRITLGGGVAVSVPTPGISIEPYLSITNRWYKESGVNATSNVGWTLGANANFGMFGVHLAYDSENFGGLIGRVGTFGLGAHVALKAPIGM